MNSGSESPCRKRDVHNDKYFTDCMLFILFVLTTKIIKKMNTDISCFCSHIRKLRAFETLQWKSIEKANVIQRMLYFILYFTDEKRLYFIFHM